MNERSKMDVFKCFQKLLFFSKHTQGKSEYCVFKFRKVQFIKGYTSKRESKFSSSLPAKGVRTSKHSKYQEIIEKAHGN